MRAVRIKWGLVLDEARAILGGYDTAVTLRQLYYRLVAAQLIPNTPYHYKKLSDRTADARRNGDLPDLIDRGRNIHEYQTFDSPREAAFYTAAIYRRDRTEGQDVTLYLGTEKAGIVNQLDQWFSDLGLPILALGGYASQTYVNDVVAHAGAQDRPAVLLYAGDHDPSGWDIQRDFEERTGCFKAVHRIALDPGQVEQYQLPEAVDNDPLTLKKLEDDSRAQQFVDRFGKLTQVELDALDPLVVRELYQDTIDQYWDTSAHEGVVEREAQERAALEELASGWEPEQQ